MSLVDIAISLFEKFQILDYWILLLIVVLESLPLVGLIIPGSIVTVFVGFLVFLGHLEPGDALFFGGLGAVIGDTISFFLGKRKCLHFRWSWMENHSLLPKAKLFVSENGGKSLILGRFFGPLRGIVPYIVGASHMKIGTFFFWNVLGGFAWIAAYMTLGYLFGHAWRLASAWSVRAGIFLLVVVVLFSLLNSLRLRIKRKVDI